MSRLFFCSLLSSFLLVVGCGESGSTACAAGEVECDGVCIDEFSTEPDLAEIQAGVFQGGCALSTSCHSGSNPAEMLDLSSVVLSETNLVNVPSLQSATLNRVEPGDSSMSYIMNKLEGVGLEDTSGGDPSTQMPQGGMLCQVKIDAVRDWIDAL